MAQPKNKKKVYYGNGKGIAKPDHMEMDLTPIRRHNTIGNMFGGSIQQLRKSLGLRQLNLEEQAREDDKWHIFKPALKEYKRRKRQVDAFNEHQDENYRKAKKGMTMEIPHEFHKPWKGTYLNGAGTKRTRKAKRLKRKSSNRDFLDMSRPNKVSNGKYIYRVKNEGGSLMQDTRGRRKRR